MKERSTPPPCSLGANKDVWDFIESTIPMILRFMVSDRDLEEMMIIRGSFIDQSPLQHWVKRFTRLIDQRVRKRKRPQPSVSFKKN